MPFPLIFAAAAAGSAFLSNTRAQGDFDAFVKDRVLQTNIQVQNLSAKTDALEGRLLAAFTTTGGSLTSGTARDLQSAGAIQASRNQFALEQQEQIDIGAAEATTNASMESPLLAGATAFVAAGGAGSFVPGIGEAAEGLTPELLQAAQDGGALFLRPDILDAAQGIGIGGLP